MTIRPLTDQTAPRPNRAQPKAAAPDEDRAADTIRELMREIGAVRSLYQQVDRDLDDAERDAEQGQGELRWARFPVQRAEQDTTDRDVSREGHEIARYFQRTTAEVGEAQRRSDNAGFDLRQVDRAVAGAVERIDRLQDELGKDAPRFQNVLQHLESAEQYLIGARGSFGQASNDAGTALTQAREVGRELGFSGILVTQIQRDTVGRDVSSEARQLSTRLDRMTWNLADAGRSLDHAGRVGDEGDGRSGLSIQELQAALQDLERLKRP